MRVSADSAEFRRNLESAFAIEMRAYDRGVACPEPFPAPSGGCLHWIRDRWFRVHRWEEGRTPPPGSRLAAAGTLLARIYRVGRTSSAPILDAPRQAADWHLIAELPGLPASLGRIVSEAASELAELEATTAASGQIVGHVESHGDLDPKNTLVADARLLALDWDAADAVPAAREAVALAVDWSRDLDGFRQVLTACTRSSDTVIPAEPWVFGGWVAGTIGWLEYNATCSAHASTVKLRSLPRSVVYSSFDTASTVDSVFSPRCSRSNRATNAALQRCRRRR